MILYKNTINEFIKDIYNHQINKKLNALMKLKIYKYASKSENESWSMSLKYMAEILSKSNIPKDCYVAIEYNIPMTNQRIDFILFGYDEFMNKNVILFELKQWSKISRVQNTDILFETFVGGTIKQVLNPVYQIWTYQELLKDYNENIQNENIYISSCVVMHNFKKIEKDIFINDNLKKIVDDIRVFYNNEEEKIVNYINEKIIKSDNGKIIDEIDNSRYTPSISLQNRINELIKDNNTIKLIDKQRIIYERILSHRTDNKRVVIINGGPGTGKSLIALNLLCNEIKSGKMSQYVSRNTAPRTVYSYKLKGNLSKNSIDNLFKTSSAYVKEESNKFDMLIVDEAHCLTAKSGLFNNYGENQIKEIINSAKTSVFFIDEKQQVHMNDIGTIEEIKKWARNFEAEIEEYTLNSQFRCSGSNEYLKFVDFILGMSKDNNFERMDYDIKVVNSLSELEKDIKEKSKMSSARIIAGYCWDWNKKELDNPDYHDIVFGDFEMSWNLGTKQTFAIDDSIEEAGCIHSVQGLEFDYVGVILGPDIFLENGTIQTDFNRHAKTDPSLKGIKKLYKEDSKKAKEIADKIIKNTYRVLMTRGIKGCTLYCTDMTLNEYIKNMINNFKAKN